MSAAAAVCILLATTPQTMCWCTLSLSHALLLHVLLASIGQVDSCRLSKA
jgi:hypothetical protein